MNLDKRLLLCADFVRPGKRVADVGSDHAYLVVWLAMKNLIPYAIASDVRIGPLLNAQKNIHKYNLDDKIETRLSDGLDNIRSSEIDDVVLAGMGGNLIINIIKRTPWLKDKSKHLILQPMSAEQELREFLVQEGFVEHSEKAALSYGKVYTAMSVFYDENQKTLGKLYPYIGLLDEDLSDEACLYIKKEIRNLKNKIKGFLTTNQIEKAEYLISVINEIEMIIKEKNCKKY